MSDPRADSGDTAAAESGDDVFDGEVVDDDFNSANLLERIEADAERVAEEVGESNATLVEIRRMLELLRRGSFSGPLPPPEILEGYKAAYPAAPEVIFSELVAQGTHRRSLERTAIERQEQRADRGQFFAFVIVLAVLAVAVVAIVAGEPWVGATLFGTTLVSVVGLFLYGNRRQLSDLLRKRQQAGIPDVPANRGEPPSASGGGREAS